MQDAHSGGFSSLNISQQLLSMSWSFPRLLVIFESGYLKEVIETTL